MVVIVEGMETEVREVQQKKAWSPMTVTDVGMDTKEREVQ